MLDSNLLFQKENIFGERRKQTTTPFNFFLGNTFPQCTRPEWEIQKLILVRCITARWHVIYFLQQYFQACCVYRIDFIQCTCGSVVLRCFIWAFLSFFCSSTIYYTRMNSFSLSLYKSSNEPISRLSWNEPILNVNYTTISDRFKNATTNGHCFVYKTHTENENTFKFTEMNNL